MSGGHEWAMGEARRQDDVERKWLGDVTQNRPSFAEAEILDRQGVPSCHAWKVPPGEVPPHLSATQALRRWQAGMCALCSARPERLLVDHCHRSGLIRGLLCTSCNTAEGLRDAPSFVAYRSRPPAVLLGMEEQYGSAWDGFALTPTGQIERNAAHVDAAEAMFADILPKFRRS